MPDIWIQIENRAWDVSPHRIDRMTGQAVAAASVAKTITSPETGVTHTRQMWKPLAQDALILRRYTPNWAAPDDRKINPWDLNELDPTDNGTMGTIPGPVIECQLGDTVTVHFRNKDARAGKALEARTHSLHPHGFVFDPRYDGAYPLTPPDPGQAVGAEAALWAALGVSGFKRGDRVPPGGTFSYTWQTIGWPTTSGVWLYHDHSICDTENVQLGAIGMIVIHNPNDPDDVTVTPADLPGGIPNGSPINLECFPFPRKIAVLPHDLIDLGRVTRLDQIGESFNPTGVIGGGAMGGMGGMSMTLAASAVASAETKSAKSAKRDQSHDKQDLDSRVMLERSIVRGETVLELSKDLALMARFCLRFYRTPPTKAQYLLLFHNLSGAEMCINGRKYLGNTPTVVGGPQTLMRFGVVGMGNVDGFHTFHLHGHRWTLNGPHGNNRAAIQGSVQDTPISQFEDTRTFGPANSFAFTIKEGSIGRLPSFMGPPPGAAVGEWHMHCHVLNHMMDGMMGSLLIVNGGEFASSLPRGVPCPPDNGGGVPPTGVVHTVNLNNFVFSPQNLTINVGDIVHWVWGDVQPHSTISDGGIWDSGVHTAVGFTFDRSFPVPGVFPYHCLIHGGAGGAGMAGTITVI